MLYKLKANHPGILLFPHLYHSTLFVFFFREKKKKIIIRRMVNVQLKKIRAFWANDFLKLTHDLSFDKSEINKILSSVSLAYSRNPYLAFYSIFQCVLNSLVLWKAPIILHGVFFSVQLLLDTSSVDLRNSKDLGSEAECFHWKHIKLVN